MRTVETEVSTNSRLDEVISTIQELDGERSNLHTRIRREGQTIELSRLLTDLQGRWDGALQKYALLKAAAGT